MERVTLDQLSTKANISTDLSKEGFLSRQQRLQRWTELLAREPDRSEEHTSELQSLMRISYAVFCLKKKKNRTNKYNRVRHKPQITTKALKPTHHRNNRRT